MPPPSGLYFGRVMHARLRPFRHRFRYRAYALWLDLEDLPGLGKRLRLLTHNRAGLFSFKDRDHGRRDGSALRPWLDGVLADAGIAAPSRVFVLCYPRVMGYVFNPLTVYYAYDHSDRLAALVYEVKNTFGEQHCYVLENDASGAAGADLHQDCRKAFYVSPFIGMEGRYRFLLRPPGETLSLVIRVDVPEGGQLIASMTGHYRPLSDATLLRALLAYPMMPQKAIAAIHWQALRLWLKGATYHPRPPAPERPASYGPESSAPASAAEAACARDRPEFVTPLIEERRA